MLLLKYTLLIKLMFSQIFLVNIFFYISPAFTNLQIHTKHANTFLVKEIQHDIR